MKSLHLFATAMCVMFATQAPAYADIGKIGGPAIGKIGAPVPAGKKKQAQKQEEGLTEDDEQTKENVSQSPITSVIFNQRRINFRGILGPVIENERQNAGTTYEVVSYIPTVNAPPRKLAKLNRVYSTNLRSIVSEMQRLGIAPESIRTRIEKRLDNSPQEISVFIAE